MTESHVANFMSRTILLLTVSFFFQGSLSAVQLNPLFSDGMVLQRDVPTSVFGKADGNEKVTVKIAGKTYETEAEDGRWLVTLEPLSAGGPHVLSVTGDDEVTISDVLVGEVWICSGQSNMEWKFDEADGAEEERPQAVYPSIRTFEVSHNARQEPQDVFAGKWTKCTPESVDSFSAVAYYFARELHNRLGVPVGIIDSTWGGTPAQAWTSLEKLKENPALSHYVDEFDSFKERGFKDFDQRSATSLFNGMVSPMIPYTMKGVAWYQGESNAQQAHEYQTLLTTMIADWRGRWGQGAFPFYFVQIAPHKDMVPELREAQFKTHLDVENTALIVTTDVGDAEDIHPRQKEAVGTRLALAALAKDYDKDIEFSGPLFRKHEVRDGKVVLYFDHLGGGLVAKGDPLMGFEIAGEDGRWRTARAIIAGENVILSHDQVSVPTAARYGWANVPEVNLFNRADLPASPFRTGEH